VAGSRGQQAASLQPWRLALVALLGAVVAEAAVAFSEGLTRAFSIDQVPGHFLAISVGALIGWLIELSRQLATTAARALEEMQKVTSSLDALAVKLDGPLRAEGILNGSPKHRRTLQKLIVAATQHKIDMIPQVGPGEYLEYLEAAIAESSAYFGVQRKPIRWYRDSNGTDYLETLNRRMMACKIRLFIIDDSDKAQMEADLRSPGLMSYYWERSSTVESYWATVSEFGKLYPGLAAPNDFALYDRSLLIQYDQDICLLRYNTINSRWNEWYLQDRFMKSPAPPNGGFRRIVRYSNDTKESRSTS